jgi:autotransporter-associated beta strand protein
MPTSFNLANATLNTGGSGTPPGNWSSMRAGGTNLLGALSGTKGYLDFGGLLVVGSLNTSTTFGGAIIDTVGVTKVGTGTLTLSGANTFTGNLTVKSGTVSVSNANGLGAGTVILGDTGGPASASLLAAGGNNTFTNSITVQSGSSGVLTIGNQGGANNSYVFSGNVALNNPLTLLAAGTGTVKLSGNLTGSSLITVTNDGALVSTSQYVDLTGANSGFTGNVAVNGGMLRLEGGTALNAASTVQLNYTNTMLNLNATADVTLAGLTGVAGGIVTNTSGAGRTLTLAGAGQYVFNGAIMDGNTTATRISLTFAGTGTNIFGGVNTYSGATLVTNGTLLVDGCNLGTNSVTVTNAGSTLGGTGVISGPVTFNAGTFAQFTLGAPLGFGGSLAIAAGGVVPQVKVVLTNNTPLGIYVLATNAGVSGSFSNTPVIIGGSLARPNYTTTILTTSTNIVLVVGVIPATVALTATPNPSVYGSPAVFTATLQTNLLTSTNAAGDATGGFIFSVDGTAAATNSLAGGVASFTSGALTAGSHVVQAFYAGDANYSAASNSLTQTVSPRPVILAGTRAYDGTAVATNLILTITNYVGSDNLGLSNALTGYAGLAGANVGTNLITATNNLSLAGGGVATNYTLAGSGGAVVITAAPLVITAGSTNKTYGQNLTLSGFTTAGLAAGDSVSSVTLTSAGATNTATAGSYSIVAAGAAGSGLANYSISYVNGTLTVTQAVPTNTLVSSENQSGYHDAVTFTNTLNADATGYVLFSTNSVLWSSNNLSGGVAVSLSITNLPRGTNVITAAYGGDTNYLGGSVSLNQVVTNHPPVANGNTYSRGGSPTWKIAISDLLTNATDLDGDTLALVGAGPSTNLVTMTTNNFGGPVMYCLYYNTNQVDDQFTYTVADGYGGTNSAVITLTYASTNAIVGNSSIAITGTTSVKVVTAYGIPGYTYVTQRATNLNQLVWENLATNTLATNAVSFSVTDSNPPSSTAYYRLLWPGY